MVVVDSLDEGLDSRSLGDLLVAHFLGHLQGSSVDTSDDGMSVWLGLCSIIEGSNNNCFPSGVAAAKDDDDLTGLKARKEKITQSVGIIQRSSFSSRISLSKNKNRITLIQQSQFSHQHQKTIQTTS